MINGKLILLNFSAVVAALTVLLPADAQSSVYVVYYATSNGKTGHMGLALSNYTVWAKGNTEDGIGSFDTVAAQELTYYDLWPDEDHFNMINTGRDIPALYYKLPVASHEKITLNRLFYQGIPHKEHYPSDGILRINATWQQNLWLRKLMDSLVDTKKDFNARKFNCADFVKLSLEKYLNVKLKSREFIGIGWSTTPNKLYRKLKALSGITVVKDAGSKDEGSFLKERVLYKLFRKEKVHYNHTALN